MCIFRKPQAIASDDARSVLMQTPKLRLHAHRLTDRTCLAVRLGLLSNLESLRISRLRDENDVQASSFSAASASCSHLWRQNVGLFVCH